MITAAYHRVIDNIGVKHRGTQVNFHLEIGQEARHIK